MIRHLGKEDDISRASLSRSTLPYRYASFLTSYIESRTWAQPSSTLAHRVTSHQHCVEVWALRWCPHCSRDRSLKSLEPVSNSLICHQMSPVCPWTRLPSSPLPGWWLPAGWRPTSSCFHQQSVGNRETAMGPSAPLPAWTNPRYLCLSQLQLPFLAATGLYEDHLVSTCKRQGVRTDLVQGWNLRTVKHKLTSISETCFHRGSFIVHLRCHGYMCSRMGPRFM